MAKRLFDILLSALGLMLLAPLLLTLALWVKLDSPGPVLFRQERVGRHGRLFSIHKIRTMRPDAPSLGPQITIGADPRVTAAGQILRRYKLDELPQLWDVLRGAMSLVGPRPEVPRYVALYPADMAELVLSVRPGITDLASIEYRDESRLLAEAADPERCYTEQVMPAKLALAARYVQTRSFGGDLVLLLQTLKAVVS
ncbi:sugar transferase [Paucibacter sp. B2R-40]|uniref:sugar transferase n=1 Tax=Paucibacter sp. B2R-40 TaxID=2893554 RepID=UPI0021E46B2A|nr:sugar transferase [Paucibacter sp. B2R-40]MCV2354538.1 sugar transferase [Paucibacter sp. B2R-40]